MPCFALPSIVRLQVIFRKLQRAVLQLCCIALFLLLPPCLIAQTDTATLSGTITDQAGAIAPDVSVTITNEDTGISVQTKTNGAGIYDVPALIPGRYRVFVDKQGFKQVDVRDITLHVQDVVSRNFSLQVGGTSETIQVNGSGNNINTTDASVSTVVDHQFVDSMPLNGRSFQSLILLAPGVVTNTPQVSANQAVDGEFSVNGQRADSNNFTVDGVSANNGPNPHGYSAAGSSGGLQATTALGTTQAVISVDALQEFKIQTSTYSAEYGRQPGAQISFETRSGTNDWHGSAFDYLRNDVFDANNWFNDDTEPVTPKPPERQNDFGGTAGGPLGIPRLYSGHDRTFGFFSYEGLRLTQPQPAQVFYVPSTGLRQNAPAALQPVMNGFPLPNCTTAMSSLCVDPGTGLSPFLLSTSLPSSLDAISGRIDERVASWLTLFFRYGYANSSAATGIEAYENELYTNTKTFTLGADSALNGILTNQFRFNYSPAIASAPYVPITYGGAVNGNLPVINGLSSNAGLIDIHFTVPGYSSVIANGGGAFTNQNQWNIVDTMSKQLGTQLLRFGIDYRRTSGTAGALSPELLYTYSSTTNVVANSPSVFTIIASQQHPEYTNLSAFVQDEWRATRVASISLGLRWELNPPPTVTKGLDSRTVNGNFENPASLTLAPAGTPLYHTTYYNFAPRVGLATSLHTSPGWELVFRSGGGVFFDTGQQSNSIFGQGRSPGTGFSKSYAAAPANAFPFTTPLSVPLESTLTPPYSQINMISQHLQLPYAFQWNATLEQSLGTNQSISIGYVGANGRRLLKEQLYSLSALNPTFTSIAVNSNGFGSSYNALQAQYKRVLSRGLQALASYTWSHSLDYESQDWGTYPYQRGNSDFDVRNGLTAALSYDLRKQIGSRATSALFGSWGTDLRFTARTGFPVTLQGNEFADPTTGDEAYSGLNLVPGVPVYVYGAQYPGGRSINSGAFTLPTGTELGDAPRNFVRGFGEDEFNFAVRRELPIHERIRLQFRAEAFNLFNHPNFGYINPTYGNALFGQATETLASSIGGLTALYQQGGPRSLQFSLRVQF
jgi:Carboxypeptidase regulatory-like domain